jgi:hypothetical protein
VNILAFTIVDNVHRYAKNGDAVLMLFDCEVDGKEFDRVELVRQTSGLAVRLPRRGGVFGAGQDELSVLAAGCFVGCRRRGGYAARRGSVTPDFRVTLRPHIQKQRPPDRSP